MTSRCMPGCGCRNLCRPGHPAALGRPGAAPSPPFWAVTGVRANDVLHLRDVPSAEAKSLAGIPPNAHGLKNLGCRYSQPPLDQWTRMNKAQRELAVTQWCRIEYQGKQGWVAARYLKKDDRAGR